MSTSQSSMRDLEDVRVWQELWHFHNDDIFFGFTCPPSRTTAKQSKQAVSWQRWWKRRRDCYGRITSPEMPTLGNFSPPKQLHVQIILIKRPFKGKDWFFFHLFPEAIKTDFIVPPVHPLMHAYICHSIYLSVPVKVEQALEKSEENSRTSAKKCPLIVSVDANNKEKGSPMEVDWKLSSGSWTDNPCTVSRNYSLSWERFSEA